MKIFRFENLNCEKIVFFGGFGFVPQNFHFSKDVLMIYDYETLNNFDEIYAQILKFLEGKSAHFLAWSMGVCVANFLFEKYPISQNFISKTALNGSIFGIHKTFGIHPIIFKKTAKNFDEKSFLKNALNSENTQSFLINKNAVNELNSLINFCENLQLENVQNNFWDRAIICQNDKIFSPDSQLLAWEKYKQDCLNSEFEIIKINAPHFAAILQNLELKNLDFKC